MDSPPVGNDEVAGVCAGDEKALTVKFPDFVKGYTEAIADEHAVSFFS
jgi:hypothetical protein